MMPNMLTPRLRLYSKKISYLRMAQGALNLCDSQAISHTEKLIASYTKSRHAILISMGRMAIFEGLRALKDSGEIILSPVTVPEVISLVHLAGFTPVFCDLKLGTWNMDVELAESLITDKTVAVMTTHFYGNTNTTIAVRKLCDKHQLSMVEDAAQALGAWQGDNHAGTIGDFGMVSFSYPKNVTSFYGGCLITNNDELASRVSNAVQDYPEVGGGWLYKKVFDCAIKDIGTFGPIFQLSSLIIRYGYKKNIRRIIELVSQNLNPAFFEGIPKEYRTKISPQQALAIADKWAEVDEDAQHRIRCADIYFSSLKDIEGLICPEFLGDRSNTFLYFPIQVEDKYALQRYMIEHYCDVAVQHAPNCADLPAYKLYYRDCPLARAAYEGTLMLPTYRGFPLDKARHYAQTIKNFFNG